MTALQFSDRVLSKSDRYIAEGRVSVVGMEDGVWTAVVRGGSGDYATTITEDFDHSTCSCPHGRHREESPALCSHVAAVLMMIRED